MSHALAFCFVVALMYVLVLMTHIPTLPRCPMCGKNKDHADDCPTNHRGGDDGR